MSEKEDARQVLIAALRLARERVTGDDSRAKLARQQGIGTVIERLKLNQPRDRVTAGEIRDLLGDPDSREIRQALSAWEGNSPE